MVIIACNTTITRLHDQMYCTVSSSVVGRVLKNRRSLHTVVLIRHGESIWNSENRFTGWSDVPLTASGEADAKDAGALIGERGLSFDVAFTSNLERAWRTCALVLATSCQSSVQTHRSWLLNERHYGGKPYVQISVVNADKLVYSATRPPQNQS